MPLPGKSTLILQGPPPPDDHSHVKPKQAMLIRMSEETFDAMTENMAKNLPLQFEHGDKSGLIIGDKFYPVKSNAEPPHHELYLRLPTANKPMAPLKFYANVVGKFMVERQLGEKVEETVRDRTLEAEKQRTERKLVFLDDPPNLKPTATKPRGKKDTTVRRPAASSSTAVQPATRPPPLPASTSNTTSSGEVSSARARLVHCVALKARTADEVVKLCAGKDAAARMRTETLDLLSAAAEPVPVAKSRESEALQRWQLKLESWREIRPYQWPSLSAEERRQLSRNARAAFKTMKIPETDPIWDYVRYRAEPEHASTTAGKSTPGTSVPAGDKNGVISKNTKKKVSDGSRKVSEITIPYKDESAKGKTRDGDQGSSAGTPTSATIPPTRRLPGSGFKVKQSVTPPVSDPRNHSPVPKREPPPSPLPSSSGKLPPPQERSVSATGATSQVRKKVKDNQASSSTLRAAERRKDDPPPPRERDYGAVGEKQRQIERASPLPASTSKRKRPPQDGDDSDRSEGELPLSASAPKRRKADDRPAPSEKSRVRDLSLPKKPTGGRELSPAVHRVKVKKEKEASPFPSALSPLRPSSVRPSALSPPRASSARPSVPPGGRTLGVDRQTSAARSPKPSDPQRGVPGKGRRRSPKYTSSEDESEDSVPVSRTRVSAAAAAASAGGSHSPSEEPPSKRVKTTAATTAKTTTTTTTTARRFKPRPLPSDRVGLRKYYSSCYDVYYDLYLEQTQRQDRIRRMLSDAEGDGRERADVSDDSMDLDELTPETVVALIDELGKVRTELEKVRQTWARLGGKVDSSSGELLDE